MRLLNKSTFSLVCIILLLGFVAVPVMAHTPGDGYDAAHDGLAADGTTPLTSTSTPTLESETGHTHSAAPMVESITAVDTMGAVIAGGTLVSNVDDNMNIVLVNGVTEADATRVLIGLADADSDTATPDSLDAGGFQLKITFAEDVYPVAAAGEAANAAPTVLVTDVFTGVTFVASSADGVDISSFFVLGTLTRVQIAGVDTAATDDDEYSLREFLVPVTIAEANARTLTEMKLPVSLWVDVTANQVYSLTQLDGRDTIQGRGNAEYKASDPFSIVDALPEDVPLDTPEVTITGPTEGLFVGTEATVMLATTGEATGQAIGIGEYVVFQTDSEGAQTQLLASYNPATGELKFTPHTTDDVTVRVNAGAVVNADTPPVGNDEAMETFTVMDAPDETAPTVTITSEIITEGDDAGKVLVTFTFSEALAKDSFTLLDLDYNPSEIIVHNSNPVKAEKAADDMSTTEVYTLLIEARGDQTETTITLKAGSVMDMVADDPNSFGDAVSKTVMLEPEEEEEEEEVMDPEMPAHGFNFTVPAQSYVILVRDKSATISNSPPVAQSFKSIVDIDGNRIIEDANIIEWAMMPDLNELFDRNAAGGGGALILRKVAGDTAAPAVGTVGISEIMWAIDVGYIGQVRARSPQWIEIHNLNTTAKHVRIYAQTGAQFTSDKVVVDTQAGDRLYGKLGEANETKMVVDVMTNYFNGSDRGTAGWDVPGSNGSSTTGINFVSMARQPKRGSFSLTRRHEDKTDKPLDGLYNNAKGAENSSDGRASGSWAASVVTYNSRATNKPESVTTTVPTTYDLMGTPGRPNTHSVATHVTKDSRTNVPASPIIINEVANRLDVDNRYEWIELKNVSDGEVNLNNYNISILTGVDSDKPFIYLPNNNNAKIPAGGVLLLVDSDPFGDADHPLEIGWNVAKNAEDQVPGLAGIGIGATSKHGRYLVVQFGHGDYTTGLPDDGNFILIVRRPDNHENKAEGGKGRAEFGKDDLDKINDIAGYVGGLTKNNYTNAVSKTDLWPLKAQGGPDDKNRLSASKVRRRQHVSTRDGRAGSGNTHNDRKAEQIAFRDVGYSGVGYKRQAANSNIHGGTPGYDNGVQKGSAPDLGTAKLVISELMLNQGSEDARTKLPQWIEIYNPSSHPVGLGGWRLIIENPRDPIRMVNLGSDTVKTILPNQTVLVVSGSARDFGSDTLPASTVFTSTRVYNVYKKQKNDFDMTSRFDPIITDTTQFRITLIDGAALDTGKVTPTDAHLKVGGKYYTISDDVGNLDGNARTSDEAMWHYPAGMTEDGSRTSLIRIFDDGVARAGVSMMKSNVKPLGGTDGVDVDRARGIDSQYSWVHAVDTEFADIFVRHTWYGSENDYGTPLNRTGQILPVQLSSFRPTLQDGKVTIRWITESELDNAGFNILRSETRNGEYKQVNTELIQGAGTTGEKTAYSWVDATAKPGVVYYYQIEDVSFAGEHQVLATTKLKGLISAKNKLTTTWSELKQASQ